MLNDTVSIIVPIYNKEKYLEKCLDSILGQTYRDLEIILVDDGSTDNSLAICQHYAEKDPRIKIYHKPNGGVSSARNLGLEKSTGTLISFADPDDSLHAECIGRITTQPFDLKMGGVNINLAGSTGLDQTIDYKARVAVPGGKTLQSVGVNIGGTFSSPKITLGIREAAEEAVKNVVDEQIQKLTGSESLSEEIAKQAENLRAEAKRAGEKLIAAAQEQRAKLVEAAASKGALARIAAEKGGDKLVQEAEKQAANLEAEAERQIEKLTSKKE